MLRVLVVWLVGVAACDGVESDREVPASAEPVAAAFSQTTVIALSFGAPLGEAGRGFGTETVEGTVRSDAESAFGGG